MPKDVNNRVVVLVRHMCTMQNLHTSGLSKQKVKTNGGRDGLRGISDHVNRFLFHLKQKPALKEEGTIMLKMATQDTARLSKPHAHARVIKPYKINVTWTIKIYLHLHRIDQVSQAWSGLFI